jgi:hypothetical protein
MQSGDGKAQQRKIYNRQMHKVRRRISRQGRDRQYKQARIHKICTELFQKMTILVEEGLMF